MHPFRFTVQASGVAGPDAAKPARAAGEREAWRELARKAEDLGYHALTIADHFGDQLAPVPAAMAAADATTTLQIGWLVLANDYRHPVVVAKEAATVDLLSRGRLLLGLGAGWMTSDYEAAGIELARPGVRVDRLAEALRVIKGLLSGGPVTFAGEHYQLSGMAGWPVPVPHPGPPILVGGGGRRVLELAAREADIVGLNVNLRAGVIDDRAYPNGTAAVTDEKVAWIRAAAGPRFGELVLQTRIHLALVDEHPEAFIDAHAGDFGLTPAEAVETPHALLGSPSKIIEDLQRRRERWGISVIGLSVDAIDAMAPVVAALAGR